MERYYDEVSSSRLLLQRGRVSSSVRVRVRLPRAVATNCQLQSCMPAKFFFCSRSHPYNNIIVQHALRSLFVARA